MKKINGCWVDENENSWDCEKHTKQEAERLSKTLVDCYNCYNCRNCNNCRNCACCENLSNGNKLFFRYGEHDEFEKKVKVLFGLEVE